MRLGKFVGLLIEPSKDMNIERILLKNDLTEPVLNEAIQKKVNMIISYHPHIFSPFKRLSQSDWKQRLIIKCIEQEIAVYSPHTSWDSIEGEINDYLLKPFGNYTLLLKLYSIREHTYGKKLEKAKFLAVIIAEAKEQLAF
jgi:putative NIF3 family GTP cyclohydrolase 1 type 2